MRSSLFCTLYLLFCFSLGAQSLRPLTKLEYGRTLYSAQRNLLYVFEGRERNSSVVKILDATLGKVQKSIKTDSLPFLQEMSVDEHAIYFITLFPTRINRLDLESEKVEHIFSLPDSISDINSFKIVPGGKERFVITWYNAQRVGISLIENGQLIAAENAGIFAFQSLMLPNDSTFYAVTGINQQLIKGKMRKGYIGITDTIHGFPYIDLGNGIVEGGFYYSPSGHLVDLRSSTPVVVNKVAPDPQFFYTQITSYPTSAYLYVVQDAFTDFKVFKISKLEQKQVESWAIAKTPGSSSFTLFTAMVQDGFFLSNYSISYLYKRCTPQTPAPRIKEGLSVFGCVVKDSTITIHAADAVHEYLWSNGATASSLTFNAGASIQLQYGDALGCLSEPSAFTNISFYPPRQHPWVNGRSEAFTLQICSKQSINLNAMESGIQDYEWSNGATGVNIKVDAPGDYRVRSIASDGCPSLWSFPVTIEQLTDSIPAKPSIKTTKGNFNYCNGETAELFVASGYRYYLWQGQQTDKPTWRVNNNASIRVQVGNDLRCLSDLSDFTTVTYYPIPRIPVVQRLTSTLATNSFGEIHEWYLNNQLIQGENGQFLNITQNGQYRVRTLVNGCYSGYSSILFVQDLTTSTQSPQQEGLQLLLSPNPVEQILYVQIRALNLLGSHYQVVGLDGKLHQQGKLLANGMLQLNGIPRGFYLLQLWDEQQLLGVARFIKQ